MVTVYDGAFDHANYQSINQSIKVICNARNVVHKLESEVRSSNLRRTVLNYYQHLYHRHHTAILQPSVLSSAVPH